MMKTATYILSYMEQFRGAADREPDTQQEEESVKDEAGINLFELNS